MTWLIVSILGLGMSYASDAYLEKSLDHIHQTVSDATSDSYVLEEHNGHCHSLVHLLGLIDDRGVASNKSTARLEDNYSFTIRVHTLTNLYRPPILT